MSHEPASYNTMPASWCAARVAEARAWRDANSQKTPGWQHVHELLNQLDRPPLPAAPAAGEATGAGLLPFVVLPAEQRAKIKRFAEAYQPCQYGKLPSQRVGEYIAAKTDYEMAVKPDVALGTLAYVEHLEAENATLTSRLTIEATAAREAHAAIPNDVLPQSSLRIRVLSLVQSCATAYRLMDEQDEQTAKLKADLAAARQEATAAGEARERAGVQEAEITDLRRVMGLMEAELRVRTSIRQVALRRYPDGWHAAYCDGNGKALDVKPGAYPTAEIALSRASELHTWFDEMNAAPIPQTKYVFVP